MDMYKFGLAVKELMAVVNEQTRKQTSSVLYTKYSKSISSPLQNRTIEFFFLENRQESMDGHLKLNGIKFYGHQFNTLFPLFPLSLYNIVTQSSRSVFPFFTSKLFCSSTRKKCQTEQTALCHPQKKNERERELASRFECSNGPAALCSQNSWPATCTTASVYTHTDIICWKKRRKEEDNETLAQLKAFFCLPFFLLLYSEIRGSVTPPLNRVEEGPGLKWTPKFCVHQRGASLHHK